LDNSHQKNNKSCTQKSQTWSRKKGYCRGGGSSTNKVEVTEPDSWDDKRKEKEINTVGRMYGKVRNTNEEGEETKTEVEQKEKMKGEKETKTK
jgi:hypothetical protein